MSFTIGGKEITQIILEGPEMDEGFLGTAEVIGKKTEIVVVPPPPNGDYRVLYEKSSFTNDDVADWTTFGYGAVSVVDSKLRVGSNSGTSLPHGVYYNKKTTMMERFRMTVDFTIHEPVAVNTNGLGIGVKSHAQANMEHYCHYEMTTADQNEGGGNVLIRNRYISSKATLNSPVNRLQFAQGDNIRMIFEQKREIVEVTVINGENQVFETYIYPVRPKYLPNIYSFAFWGFKGLYDVNYIKIESDEIVGADFLFFGDSKLKGYFADTHPQSTVAQLRETFGSVVNYSGGSVRMYNAIDAIDDILELAPKRVVMNMGSNDNRENRPVEDWGADYDLFVSTLEANNIEVIHLLILEETATDVTAYNNRTIATYPNGVIWDAGTLSLEDGAHLDQTGMDQLAAFCTTKMNEILNP